jgi:hypothetical protein
MLKATIKIKAIHPSKLNHLACFYIRLGLFFINSKLKISQASTIIKTTRSIISSNNLMMFLHFLAYGHVKTNLIISKICTANNAEIWEI